MKQVIIHTDGGCHGNPGPGGWAAVLEYGKQVREISGGTAATTNNRMELQAAISAIKALKEPCRVSIFTDSEYLRNGINSWIKGWKRNGWRTAAKQPVKNADLWRELDEQASRHEITWNWLKGHAGHPGNERCDELANAQIAKIKKQLSSRELREQLEEFKREQTSPPRDSKENTRELPIIGAAIS